MKYITLFIILSPLASFANVGGNMDCKNIEKYQLALSVHASNWSNSITTRTPSGGTYKYKEILCKESCNVIESKKTFMKFEPGHPDANKEGYVEYPDISKDKERAALTTYAKAIQALSHRCPNKMSFVDNSDSFAAEYKSGFVRSDIFNFDSRSMLVSWVRESADGVSQILNF